MDPSEVDDKDYQGLISSLAFLVHVIFFNKKLYRDLSSCTYLGISVRIFIRDVTTENA